MSEAITTEDLRVPSKYEQAPQGAWTTMPRAHTIDFDTDWQDIEAQMLSILEGEPLVGRCEGIEAQTIAAS